ncbi:MAG: 50S ribosomal protein L23 [Sedimentisphaerales bacterium]|jgi:large subunit ribosomal protein L23
MHDHNIIVRPLITEQGTHLAGKISAYAFEVNKVANKQQIKGAVERLYNVKVSRVRTANRKGKLKRKGRAMGYTADWKKAVVYLEKDYHIDLF